MFKKYKIQLIITTIVTLLPILAGILLWDQLPDQIATHWGPGGKVDGWSSKPVAVFGIPLFVAAIHWICFTATALDKRTKNQNGKAMGIVLCICPAVSVFVAVGIYGNAMEKGFDMPLVTMLLVGLLFAFIGNYLPKITQNRTLGIKIIWTLQDEANWNATHRMAGKVWFVGGLLLMASALLPSAIMAVFVVVIFATMILIPVVYSYTFHKKNKKQ